MLTVKLNSLGKLFDSSSKIAFILFCMGLPDFATWIIHAT